MYAHMNKCIIKKITTNKTKTLQHSCLSEILQTSLVPCSEKLPTQFGFLI
jgi:hypothetical protein